MMAYSLRLRLLVTAAIAIFVALAIALVVMTLLFQRHLERQLQRELHRTALQVVDSLHLDSSNSVVVRKQPSDPRYDMPESGLYWQIATGTWTRRSPSLGERGLAAWPNSEAGEWRFRKVEGPFGERVFLLEGIVRPPGLNETAHIQFARGQDKLRRASVDFALELGLFLFVLWIVLSSAAWVQVHLGLQPLSRLPLALAALRGNASTRLGPDFPREVEPLARAINELADARETDLARARERAADLAHGLKTPLAALAAQSRRVGEGSDDPRVLAEGLDRAIAAAAWAVERELARARAAASRHSPQEEHAAPLCLVQRLLAVLKRTEKGMRLDYAVECAENLDLAVGEENLSEILGPLLENAVKFARRQVRVSGQIAENGVGLSIEDDGPGIAASDVADVMVRGRRLDQAGGGHGLGLAIARELVEVTGGTITLGGSPLGGLRVDLHWPERRPRTLSRAPDSCRAEISACNTGQTLPPDAVGRASPLV